MSKPKKTGINEDFLISAEEAYDWHVLKDKGGPTFSGNESWQSYITFIEEKLRGYGVIDIIKNKWTYNRWYTSEWLDSSNWTLISDGEPVKVAHYGAYSGATGADGVTAELVYYDPTTRPSVKGKIAVFTLAPEPKQKTLEPLKTDPNPNTLPPNISVSDDAFIQNIRTTGFTRILKKGQAAGGIVIFDMSYDRVAGLYTFPVPVLYNVPTLYLDRNAGAKVVRDAKKGRMATLKLLAKIEATETYQLIGCLPGKHYGTGRDEKILLITHTDGPCISQDNGALGVLGIIAYFSQIPQAERPRTLLAFLDNRHYMPGGERAFKKENWFARNKEAKGGIVAVIGIEHLGQIEYREVGEIYEPTGKVEQSFLWARNNQSLVDMANKAVADNQLPRPIVQREGDPGVIWFGMGQIAVQWDLPGFAIMSKMGAYWTTAAGIDKFDKNLFRTQVATMIQLTEELMKIKIK